MSKLDRYPIPKIEDLFAKLIGSRTFTKIDLSQAYQHITLYEESQKYVMINTHKRLLKYTYHLEFIHHLVSFSESWKVCYREFLG